MTTRAAGPNNFAALHAVHPRHAPRWRTRSSTSSETVAASRTAPTAVSTTRWPRSAGAIFDAEPRRPDAAAGPRRRRAARRRASTSPTSAPVAATRSTSWPRRSRPRASSASTSPTRPWQVGRAEATDVGARPTPTFEASTPPRSTAPGSSTSSRRSTPSTTRPSPDGGRRHLRVRSSPGGYWLCVDIQASSHVGENLDHPMGTFGYSVSCMHCMTVSLAYDGDGLGAMWGVQQARRPLRPTAGFDHIHVHTLPGDPLNNYYVCHKAG